MPNSKYPQQLDTSVEIPPVRDNITEIGSDVLNSLRSAIFNIEKTLGINPQGSSGNSLAARISKSLDENGNILKEALDRSNILSGPIIDADVSRVAGIQEDKLKLDFPTRLLQSQISSLNSELSSIINTVTAISTDLSVHLSPQALKSHRSQSITVDSAATIPSDSATTSLESGTVQTAFEILYNSHINYSGFNISELNNSHLASQIYYNNENTSSFITSNNIQDALDDVVNIQSLGLKNVLSSIASNGRVRRGISQDYFENIGMGSLVLQNSKVSYSNINGSSYTTFTLITPLSPLEEIKEFDIVTMVGANNQSFNKEYRIKSVTLNGLGKVQSISVYAGPTGNSNSETFISVTKNKNVAFNIAGFSSTVRPRAVKTDTPDVQVLLPDCATIITKNISPSSITSTSHTFNISVDSGIEITIDTYNGSYATQTLETIIQTINDQAVDQHLNFTAFKTRVKGCYELAIAHNVPNFSGDIQNRTIKINIGTTNDGTSTLGLSDYIDKEIEGVSRNSVFLNGNLLDKFGQIKTFTNNDLEILTGSLSLASYSGTFYSFGVRVGDLVVITGSTVTSDDGTYRVKAINENSLDLDLTGTLFSGELSETGNIIILQSTASVGEFTFEEIGLSDGTILFDVFLDEDKNILHKKRLEIEGSIQSGGFSAVISDVSKDFILDGEVAIVDILSNGYATLTDVTSSTGESIFVGSTGEYKLFASDGLAYIVLSVNCSSNPTVNLSHNIYGFKEAASNNYHISRGAFSTAVGRILGDSTDPGIPSLVDKRVSGTADTTVISNTFVEKYIEGPRNELRGSGVVRGCLVSNSAYFDNVGTSDDYQTFSISAGVVYVNGIRFEFPGIEDFRVNTLSTYVVAIDGSGCVLAAPYITSPYDAGLLVSPFFEMNVAHIAEVSSSGTIVTDLRLFVDHLDYKVLGSIKVSKDIRNGHFTSIDKAVSYGKRYSKLFPELNPPEILIEAGNYVVEESIVVDYDVTISGVGPGTVIERDKDLHAPYSSDKVDMTTAIFLVGSSPGMASSLIESGVTFKNFTYKSVTNLVEVACFVALSQVISKDGTDVSPDAIFRFENINFIGPESIAGGAIPDANKVGDFIIYGGQQFPNLIPKANLHVGNIIFTNCYALRMGLELGGIKFTESGGASEVKNILVSNNIIKDVSPTAILVEYPSGPSVSGIVESSNVVV